MVKYVANIVMIVFLLSSCDRHSGKIGHIKTVLILGNSIVRHPVLHEIGWNNDWGMAASCMDSDFVHRLIRHVGKRATVQFKNIAEYERTFPTYPLDSLPPGSFDMIVVKISENVDAKKAADSNFYDHYADLINHLDPHDSAVKILVDGFWDKPAVNGQIAKYARSHNCYYVTTTDLSADTTNQARQYHHPGIAIHPNDKGMRFISERIWGKMRLYF